MLTGRICVFRIDLYLFISVYLVIIKYNQSSLCHNSCSHYLLATMTLSLTSPSLYRNFLGRGRQRASLLPASLMLAADFTNDLAGAFFQYRENCLNFVDSSQREGSRKAQERFRELVNLIFLWLWPRLILTVNTGDRFSRDRDGDRGSGSMRATDYHVQCPVCTRAANDPSVLIITEETPTSAFSWLKVSTIAFTFKTLC